jgi:PS-10 peptidase S37
MAEFGPMNRAVGFIAAALLVSSACGDNVGPPPLTRDQLLDKLRSLPGVTATDSGTVPGVGDEQLLYYVLHFAQPVDHDDPSKGYFEQQVSLLHRSELAPTPMIVNTSGYADTWGSWPVELTLLLDANQISIEHRFYGTSRPEPADWSFLTIKQMAKDEHDIITALQTIYGGAFVSTGVSKGGMTAVFHRSSYPDDVAGTVAYVAPISFDAPDPRYLKKLDEIGTNDCRNAVRAVASRLLVRAPQMQALAQQQADQNRDTFTRVALGPAVEAAIAWVEWNFWQNRGITECGAVPPATASDADLYAFLSKTSAVTDYDDEQLAQFEAYYYQIHSQLGFPLSTAPYLSQDLTYGPSDYLGELPTAAPSYDRHWMDDIDDTVEHNIDQLIFIYGDWDPWTGGAFPTGQYAQKFVVDQGTHRSKIADLEQDKRDAALAYVAQWTGVTPVVARLRRPGTAGAGASLDLAPPPPMVHAAPR